MAKIFAGILIVLILWLQYRVLYGDNGIQKLAILKEKIAQQQKQNTLLEEQNKVLKAEITLLRNNPEVLEEKAREQLGLIKKGEIFYRVIPDETK